MRALVLLLALTCFAHRSASQSVLEDIQQFTRGWLVGVFNQDVAAEATECLDLNTLEGHIKNAIDDFKQKTPEGIKNGVIELFEFFVALPKAIDLCLSEHADVMASMKAKTAAIINYINNPDDLGKAIAKNTITHGITIFEDLEQGIQAIKAQNWYEVGKDFGDAVDLALFGTSSFGSTQDDIKNFLRGWLVGVFNTDVAGNVVECLDINALKDSIDRMVEDFKQKDVTGIVNGIKELFGLFQALPAAVDACLASQQDVASQMKSKIAIIGGYIADPAAMAKTVLSNSIKHGFTLFGDISDGISAINSGNWQQAGQDFGDALDLALFGNTMLQSVDDVKAFLKGWLIGVFNQDVSGEVVECLDIASLEGHVQQAILDFQQKTVEGIKNGIIELFDVFVALPGAIGSCLTSHPDVAAGMVKRVETIITYIEDPALLGKTVLVNVFKHGVTIFHDIENGVSAIKAGNYQEAGTDFGDALDASLFGTLAQSQDLTNAKEFMRGWLIGVFDQDVAGEVAECLNLQDLIIHIDNSINDFKKGTATGVEEGLKELLDVFLALPSAIDVCLYQHGDVATDMKNHVNTIISYIQDPSQLTKIVAQNFLYNWLTIIKDTEDAFAQIKAENWRQAGLDFGDAVDLSLFGQLAKLGVQSFNQDFLQGFLNGFFHEDVAQEVTECMDIAGLEQHIANAINDFKLLNLQGFLDGFKELIYIYSAAKSGADKCSTDHQDLIAKIKQKISEVEEIVQDPSQLEQIIMSNIEAHGLKIVIDINDVLSSIKAANWRQAGFDFGEVIDLILFGQNKLRSSGTIEDVEAFVKGLLVGVFRDDILAKATDCMDLQSIEQHIQNLYDDFAQFTLQGFIAGFKELLALYTETQQAVKDCLNEYPEIQESALNKIKVISQIINDPSSLEKNIMANLQLYGTAIIFDLKDAAWAVQNKQWYQAGHDTGDLVNLLIFGNKLGMNQDQIEQLLRGFLAGVFQEDVAGEVVECLKLDEVNQHIQAAIADFKQMTLDGIKNGVVELLKIYEMITPAINQCMTEHQDVAERMKAKIAQVKTLIDNPSQIVPTIKQNFISNAFTVMSDLLGCFNQLKSGNYQEAGRDLGEASNLLLFGKQVKLESYQLDIKAFVQGFIIGVFQEDVAGEVTECLQLDVINQHLQAALADFKQLNIEGFENGAKELLAIFELLPAAINQCMTDHQAVAERMKAKIAQMEQYIQDPSQLLPLIETNFKAHAFSIIKDVAGAGAALISGNSQQAGQYLGETANYLLFGGALKQTTDDIKAFIQGWIVGVFKEDVAEEAVECLQLDVINQHLQAALADFKQLTIQGIEQGAFELYIVFKLLPAGIDQCMTDHQDVAARMKAKIDQVVQLFENPSQLLPILEANLKNNFFAVIKDLADAGESIQNKNWKQAGQDLGDLTNILLFDGQVQVIEVVMSVKLGQAENNVKDFVKGWLIGVFKQDVAGSVVECLDFEEVNQHLQAALADFKLHTADGFKAGAIEILAIFEILPTAVDSCLSQHQDVAQQIKARIQQIKDIAQNPDQLVELLKTNALAHGFSIIKDLAHATSSIISGNWEQAGEALGDCTNLLLFGGQRSVVQEMLSNLRNIA